VLIAYSKSVNSLKMRFAVVVSVLVLLACSAIDVGEAAQEHSSESCETTSVEAGSTSGLGLLQLKQHTDGVQLMEGAHDELETDHEDLADDEEGEEEGSEEDLEFLSVDFRAGKGRKGKGSKSSRAGKGKRGKGSKANSGGKGGKGKGRPGTPGKAPSGKPAEKPGGSGEKPGEKPKEKSEDGKCSLKRIPKKVLTRVSKASGAHLGQAKKMWGKRAFTCMSASKKAWCHLGGGALKADPKAITYQWSC